MEAFATQTEDRQNLTFQLMSIMGIDDIEIAYYALKAADWNLESVINDFIGNNNNQPPPPPPFYPQNSYEEEEIYPEQDLNVPSLQQRKQAFNEMFPVLNLNQQTSDIRHLKLKKMSSKVDQQKLNNYINKLEQNKEFANQLVNNNKAFQNNKGFILYLNQHLKTKIRFSFGSFASNLAFSFLTKKPLLVYVHNENKRASGVLTALLQDPLITDFVNKNFVVYGVFDNSNDYEVISKDLPIASLPGVACYCYDDKKNQRVFLGGDKLLNNNPKDLISLLQTVISKTNGYYETGEEKPTAVEKQKPKQTHPETKQSSSSLIDEQNQIYKQMEQEYKLKRQVSKLNKEQKAHKLQTIEEKKLQFAQQPSGPDTIQIIFRLPLSGSLKRKFPSTTKIQTLYTYIECFGSDSFQNQYGEFQLIQTFPPLNLDDKKKLRVDEVFPESSHQNLIVREK